MNKDNIGVENSGDGNTGNRNSGHRNSGDGNTGNWNSGNWNSGDGNTGNWNSGDGNTGNWNSGYRNSGDGNSGYWNSGNRNSGYWNSGHMNSGNMNSGNMNSGNMNSGYWNSGDRNSGHFNTTSPDKIRIFNTWVNMTSEEFNLKYNIYADIPLNRWVDLKDIENPTIEQTQMGGYLKTLDFKEACQIWWNENPKRHQDFLSLPAFNAKIFKEITGVDVEKQTTLSDDELIAELERRGKIKSGKIVG
jgi:hypothetical protein